MIPQSLISHFVEYDFLLEKAKKDIHKFLTYKDIPLEDRWETYLATPAAFLETEDYVVDFTALEDKGITWFDDFFKERHSTVIMSDIVEHIEDCAEDNDDSYPRGILLASVDINALKEEILQKCIYSFTYDW